MRAVVNRHPDFPLRGSIANFENNINARSLTKTKKIVLERPNTAASGRCTSSGNNWIL